MGWWRRNRWGLVAIVPAVLALLALSAESLYYTVYLREPRQPLPASADGSFDVRGTKVRLVDLSRATDLKQYDGTAFAVAPNVIIWRARIEFTLPPGTDPDDMNPAVPRLGGCTITLQAADGRSFDDDPHSLLRGAADVNASGCFAGYDAPDPLRYVNAVYFALPPDAEPVSVNVSDALTLPRYVRLIPG
jgi:hypothetical protein